GIPPCPMPFCGITYLSTRLSKIRFTHELRKWPLIEAHGGNHGTTHKSPPTRFLKLFRMSLADFIWLADKLWIELAQDRVCRGQPLSFEAQVWLGLYRLAHGTPYFTIAHVFCIGKETADKASGRFVNAVIKVFRFRAVNFPSLDNATDWSKIMESFEKRQGIPRVVGAIDGIIMPLDNNWKSYINRKSWASIVLQCVVDGNGNFRNISGGGGGSMHDRARIPPMILRGTFLVGDAGYPGNVNILLPYPSVVDPANQWFNYLQSSTRIVVEQAFGRLKNRFRILLHSQNASPGRARNNTFACMILHNLLNRRGSLYVQGWNARTTQENYFAELPVEGPDRTATESSGDATETVSMITKRNIIRDILYCP
ncbi:hypothetical protein VP01_3857g1, partial [Puccinia sorghi]